MHIIIFLSGHISEVKQHDTGGNYSVIFVKASVEPGQHQNCFPYIQGYAWTNSWAIYVSSHCTCMAALVEACSHIAAVLFSIDSITQHGINSDTACTSVKCIWSDFFKKNVSGVSANRLDVSRPRQGPHTPTKKWEVRRVHPEHPRRKMPH